MSERFAEFHVTSDRALTPKEADHKNAGADHTAGRKLAHEASGKDALAHASSAYVRGAVQAIHDSQPAVIGFGDKEVVYKALSGKSEAQIREMKALYRDKYKVSLRDGIQTDINVPVIGDYLGSMDKADAMLNHRDQLGLKNERAHLEKAAGAKMHPDEINDLHDNMAKLEARRGVNKISDVEVARTYREVSKLLDAKGDKPLNDDQRKRLALEVMYNAGSPTSIFQGKNNTCSMNSVEITSYMNAPSEAARIVSDVALTGRYIDRNGNVIENSPAPRTPESQKYPLRDSLRNHASEIFQITAANIMYRQENMQVRFDQLSMPAGHPANDSGERLYDTSKHPEKPLLGPDGMPVRGTGVGPRNFGILHHLVNTITGEDRVSAAVAGGWVKNTNDTRVEKIGSQHQLEQFIAQSKRENKLPMLVHIDTDTEPFFSNSGGQIGGSGLHVVTVIDYHPRAKNKPAQINLDSNWNARTNYIGEHRMDLRDLYLAMQPPGSTIKLLQADLDAEHKQGKKDDLREKELQRLKEEQRAREKNKK